MPEHPLTSFQQPKSQRKAEVPMLSMDLHNISHRVGNDSPKSPKASLPKVDYTKLILAQRKHRLNQTWPTKSKLIHNYKSTLKELATPEDVAIYEATAPGDMLLFLSAVHRDDNVLASHVQHIVFTSGFDDMENCGFLQNYGIDPDTQTASIPEDEILSQYPHAACYSAEDVVEERNELLNLYREYFNNARFHSDIANRQLLDFYGERWAVCENVRTITFPVKWYTVISGDADWFKTHFPNVNTAVSFAYTYDDTEYVVIGDDKAPGTTEWERTINRYMASKPGDMAYFVALLYRRGSQVATGVKHLVFDTNFDNFESSGLFELLGFADAMDPKYAEPVTPDFIDNIVDSLSAAKTPLEHSAINIRLVPRLHAHPSGILTLDRLLGSMVTDLFRICENVRSIVVPLEWLNVFRESSELFPRVNWHSQAKFRSTGSWYIGDAKYLCETMAVEEGRILRLVKEMQEPGWDETKVLNAG